MKRQVHWGQRVSQCLWPLDGEMLRTEAGRRTGLNDFGDPPLEPGLSVLVGSLEKEADLRPVGRFLIRNHLRELLETRLRLTEAWKQAKGGEASPIIKPVFITGMPRSGSTFLHELLMADPENRAPQVWEVMFPIPAPTPELNERDLRIRRTAARLWWFRRLAPQADSVHPLRARTPQECIAIHSYTFLSEEFLATCRIPAYERFLHGTDLRPAYLWQHRFVRHLQSRYPARRWVFKSPDHVYGLEELFSVFPDAVVIQTHRNPLKVLRSSARLVQVLHEVFARPVDADQIARREAHFLAEAIERFTRFRDAHPELEHRFIDVRYSELVSDPVGAVRRIYQRLDIPLGQTAAGRMRRLAACRSRYPKRFPSSQLAQNGLEAFAEAGRFERYCLRFGLRGQDSLSS